jgi:hypothetical protein
MKESLLFSVPLLFNARVEECLSDGTDESRVVAAVDSMSIQLSWLIPEIQNLQKSEMGTLTFRICRNQKGSESADATLS